jgi:hypothetical protein
MRHDAFVGLDDEQVLVITALPETVVLSLSL